MEDLGVGERTILNSILKQQVGCRDMDWVDLTRGRDWWLAVVNAATNFEFP